MAKYDELPCAIVAFDAQTRCITSFSARAEALFGYTKREALSMSLSALLPDCPPLGGTVAAVHKDGHALEVLVAVDATRCIATIQLLGAQAGEVRPRKCPADQPS